MCLPLISVGSHESITVLPFYQPRQSSTEVGRILPPKMGKNWQMVRQMFYFWQNSTKNCPVKTASKTTRMNIFMNGQILQQQYAAARSENPIGILFTGAAAAWHPLSFTTRNHGWYYYYQASKQVSRSPLCNAPHFAKLGIAADFVETIVTTVHHTKGAGMMSTPRTGVLVPQHILGIAILQQEYYHQKKFYQIQPLGELVAHMQLGMQYGGDNLMIATSGTRGIRQQGLGFRTRDWQLLIVAEGILESHKRVLTQWISSCRA